MSSWSFFALWHFLVLVGRVVVIGKLRHRNPDQWFGEKIFALFDLPQFLVEMNKGKGNVSSTWKSKKFRNL